MEKGTERRGLVKKIVEKSTSKAKKAGKEAADVATTPGIVDVVETIFNIFQ